MKRRSPPWGAIEAFVFASRAGSFRQAADQLALSPGAFSRRVQSLEDYLGLKLLVRNAPTPTLTVAGERYLQRLLPGYESMRDALDAMAPDSAEGPAQRPLRVGVSQSFAMHWLVPRLPSFHAQVPGIEVAIHTSGDTGDLRGGGADVSIRYGSGQWADLRTRKLFDLEAFVVSAPRLADGRGPPRDIDALNDYRLLQLAEPTHYWDDWLAGSGYRGPAPHDRASFDSVQVMYEAASRGMGVALGIPQLVEGHLASGRLQLAFDLTRPLPGGYYVAALPEVFRQRAVQSFCGWLAGEAGCGSRTPTPSRLSA